MKRSEVIDHIDHIIHNYLRAIEANIPEPTIYCIDQKHLSNLILDKIEREGMLPPSIMGLDQCENCNWYPDTEWEDKDE